MNLGAYLDAAISRAPEAIAIVEGEIRWTYAELGREIECVAGGLWTSGLRHGDRVMTVLRNRREHVALFWACQLLGLVYVPVSHHYAPSDIAHCIADAEPEALFYDDVSAAVVSALAARHALPPRVYLVGDTIQAADGSDRLDVSGVPFQRTGAFVRDDTVAVTLYSSGATGRPKGVPRSHTNEVSATLAHIIQNHYSAAESALAVAPFYHTMGLRVLLSMMLLNGTLVFPLGDTAGDYLEAIERERVSSLYAFPSVFHDLLAELSDYDVRSLKKLTYAGAPMPGETVQRCIERFAPEQFVNHFGSTEIYTYSTCDCLSRKPGCAGKAGIYAQLRVVHWDDDMQLGIESVRPGEVGELAIRMTSPEAFRGYWNRPDLTAKAIREGWYYTGDLVRVDDEGDLWVMGRVDDLIISDGEKIYPSEVEAAIRAHPKVRDVVVMGLSDKRAGQVVTAFVVPDDPTVTSEDLLRFSAEHTELADFKRPARVVVVASIPRTATGKVKRRELVHWRG